MPRSVCCRRWAANWATSDRVICRTSRTLRSRTHAQNLRQRAPWLATVNLRNALDRKDGRGEAAEHLRALIDKIVLTPEQGREDLRIDLHGDLAGILSIASQKRARPENAANNNVSGPNKIALVAGAGFEPAIFGL